MITISIPTTILSNRLFKLVEAYITCISAAGCKALFVCALLQHEMYQPRMICIKNDSNSSPGRYLAFVFSLWRYCTCHFTFYAQNLELNGQQRCDSYLIENWAKVEVTKEMTLSTPHSKTINRDRWSMSSLSKEVWFQEIYEVPYFTTLQPLGL